METITDHEASKRTSFKKRGVLFFILFLFLLFFGTILMLDRLSRAATDQPIFAVLKGFIHARDIPLQGAADDRINILLLGIGGPGHEGGLLADTIIIASVRPSTNEVALLSIPRDLSVPSETYGWQKINTIHAFAESTTPGTGGPVTAATLGTVLEIPIPYFVRIDFQGFEDVIEALGGVTVNVEHRLEDFRYPIRGKELVLPIEDRFEHLLIEPGEQTMDGATALKYARSRYAKNGEGSDFARARRQQNVLRAVQKKILSFPTLVNPLRMERLLTELKEQVATNLTIADFAHFADIARDIDGRHIMQITLDDAPTGLLEARQIHGAYVLLPKDSSWGALRALTRTIFTPQEAVPTNAAPAPTTASTPIVRPNPATVVVLNGTTIAGLATQMASLLEEQGFVVTSVGNAAVRPQPKTTIAARTGADAEAQRRLELFFGVAAAPSPTTDETTASDFTVILGADARIPGEQ